ncbi:helix-turn-helix domain-containing protein [Alloyangia pacifica]|uniref:helix-turn-helix domain-containing protein n=1 Tax=Alloyangia pacifica TaxID=311180 RepID=UPI001CFDFA89|nr:helix-turn-helix domain-containing protein [Alloyangia pacifica]
MESIKSAAFNAGARENCVQSMGPVFRPIRRWSLFDLVKASAEALALNPGDLTALRAMLTFLPLKDGNGTEVPATHEMLLICYASNASICERTEGMDESNLRRHIRKLVDRGLVRRKDSATGKRFPLKSAGVVVDAFGIDLRPLFQAAEHLQGIATKIREEDQLRRNLRSEAFSLRRRLLDLEMPFDASTQSFLNGLTNFLRRKSTTVPQIAAARDRLLNLLKAPCPARQDHATSKTCGLHAGNTRPVVEHLNKTECSGTMPRKDDAKTGDLPASDGRITRQVESQTLRKKHTQLRKAKNSPGVTYADLLRRNPHAASFLPEAEPSDVGLVEALYGLGVSLGIKNAPYTVILQRLGLHRLVDIFDQMITRVETISNPQRYFEVAIVQSMPAGYP